MSFKETLEKIEHSAEFKNFKKDNPHAKMYSAFFTMRNAHGNILTDSRQIDYLLGKEKIVTFFIQDDQVKVKMDKLEKPVENFKPLETKIKIELEDVKKMFLEEIKKQKIISDITEAIIILQKVDNKQIWNIIVIFSSFQLLKMHIDMEGKILLDQKENAFDMIHVEKGKKNEKQEKTK
jgi:hypothetical protein